jgi:hypothetical protein
MEELMEDCPYCHDHTVAYYHGAWRVDDGDGYTGTAVYFCPICGGKLPQEVKHEENQEGKGKSGTETQ